MSENIRCFFTVMLFLGTFAMYAGDDPCAATNLSTSSSDFLVFDNSGNTDSGIEAPVIGGYTGSDIWFSFTMPAAELTLLLQHAGMVDPAVAIYSGDCNDPLLLYNVIDNNCDGSVDPELLITDLTSGEIYFIRVWSQDGSSNGTFGIFLGTDVPTLLAFEVFADASIQDDCIELTPEANGQQGCAWYQLEVDFSQPFTHEMLANFGDNSFNGADGICLVYQSNGPDFCGGTGAGIGAESMPNSAIFEFDTYQNSGNPYFDPFFDHTSFNVNGNMTHPASINGPVTLGNIEDGADHTILFNWDPAGNLYELFFDGTLILSGSYDIINNCFGGNTLAYWGYTASTGALNNNHVICPLGVEYTPATVAYEEVSICAGESYNGWTEPGFYIREEPGANGCSHQIHTRLSVLEESDPYQLEKYICDGETFVVEGNLFIEEGVYTIDTQTALGCDSTIILYLKVIIPTIEILGHTDFTCLTDSISLTIDFDVNYPIADVDFFWDTPNGTSQSDSIIATTPGLYSVNTFINYEDVLCIVGSDIQLNLDTIAPIIDTISDLTILCNTPVENRILVAPENPNSLDFSWSLNNTVIGTGDTLAVSVEGIYTLSAQDPINGCVSTTTAEVNIDEDIPTIEIEYDSLTLNCQSTEYTISPTITYQEPGSIVWEINSTTISNDTSIIVNESGIYALTITDVNGCIVNDSVIVSIDTIAPTLVLNDIIIPCDQTDTLVNSISLSNSAISLWEGPQVLTNELTPLINTAGVYSVTLTDNTNFCMTSGSMLVDILGASPEIEISGDDTLNCIIISAEIIATLNQNDASLNWFASDGTLLSDNPILSANTADTYIAEAMSVTGCTTIDSIELIEDILFPLVTLESDTIDCDNLQATIDGSIISGTIDSWETPDNINPTTSSIITDIAGTYTLNAINIETGCISTDSIEVIDQSNPPSYTFASNTITCNETSVILNLDISSAFQSVTWTFPDATTSNEVSPEINANGIYNLHIEVEGSCDLDTIIEIEIDTISPSYELDFGIIDCTTNNTFLNLTNANNIESIIITSPTNSVFNNLENTVIEGGIYSINTIANNGCTTTSSIEIISLVTPPEVTIVQDTLVTCDEPIATITAISNNTNLGYTWTDDQANTIGNTNTTTVNSGGTYLLTIADENGCENIYNVIIEEELDLPNISLIADNITCSIMTSTIILESETVLTNIIWSDVNGIVPAEEQLVVDQVGWYYVQGSNLYGCESFDSILVTENIDTPLIDLISSDSILLLPNSTSTISINEISSGNVDYQWLPTEGLSCSDCLEPTIIEYVHDSYQLTVTNEFGCISTITIFVRAKKLTEVIIPNIFSPSSIDGANDQFTLYGNENVAIINEMYVYDRWGNLVFSNMNFAPNDPYLGWDGLYKGESVVNGVYVYLFRITTTEDEVLTFTGDVTKI